MSILPKSSRLARSAVFAVFAVLVVLFTSACDNLPTEAVLPDPPAKKGRVIADWIYYGGVPVPGSFIWPSGGKPIESSDESIFVRWDLHTGTLSQVDDTTYTIRLTYDLYALNPDSTRKERPEDPGTWVVEATIVLDSIALVVEEPGELYGVPVYDATMTITKSPGEIAVWDDVRFARVGNEIVIGSYYWVGPFPEGKYNRGTQRFRLR